MTAPQFRAIASRWHKGIGMDQVLNEIVARFFWPAVLIFGGGVVLVRVLRALLYRFAPSWLVGPNGLLIDTRTGHGMLQMGDGNENWRAPGHHGDGSGRDC